MAGYHAVFSPILFWMIMIKNKFFCIFRLVEHSLSECFRRDFSRRVATALLASVRLPFMPELFDQVYCKYYAE